MGSDFPAAATVPPSFPFDPCLRVSAITVCPSTFSTYSPE
jgi:hypothetical protein